MQFRIFRRTLVCVSICIFLLLLNACSGDNGQSSAGSGAAPTQTATTTNKQDGTPIQGTGTAVIATTTPVTSTPTVTTGTKVEVTLTDTEIISPKRIFGKHAPYVFVVTNKGKSAHNFIITRIKQSNATAIQQPLYIVPAVQPGTTKLFAYTFPDSATASQLEFSLEIAGPNGNKGPRLPIQLK